MSAIEDARHLTEDGAWELRIELRNGEDAVSDETTVWFRRPIENLPTSFGFRVWSLRRAVGSTEWRESFRHSGIHLDHKSAQAALTWAEGFTKDGKRSC